MNPTFNEQALEALAAVNPIAYASERNYIGKSTRLSVYITRGVLTLPQIDAYVGQSYSVEQRYKLIFELAWREYWQREWAARGDEIFKSIKNEQLGVESLDLPAAVVAARTGITALDDGIEELYQTGYIHNHVRMWLAGLLCNVAHTGWWQPSKWMYYYLLDGDPASNMLSWQWVAGTFSSKRYLPAQDNINQYTRTKQRGSYLDQSYEQLALIETPEVLRNREPIDLIWTPPQTEELIIDASKPTLLYHSFFINADWHKDIDANRILVLEPQWFDKFPVAEHVTQVIIAIARDIPGLQIFVGNFDILAARLGDDIRYMSHPSVPHWSGVADELPRLFPGVPLRSYNSFMSFWKQCEKQL